MAKRSASKITDEDLELVEFMGEDTTREEVGGPTAREQRIMAGFEDIQRFYAEHGRLPQHGADRDIFERIYAVRLDRLRELEECRTILAPMDTDGLLAMSLSADRDDSSLSDDELLAEILDPQADESDITKLVHVRARDEIRFAEEFAKRIPCPDFHRFRKVFEECRQELKSGERESLPYRSYVEVNAGDLYILGGQMAYVASKGDSYLTSFGRLDCRLRVIYDNETESDLLLRSLQKALYRDGTSRRLQKTDYGPLFSGELTETDVGAGTIYVLRSQSTQPWIASNRLVVHKIGVTTGDVKRRIGNAEKDPTYLLAPVEIVATYQVVNISPTKLEGLIHGFFGGVRLDMQLKDRFGFQVVPREWFLVPLTAIDDCVEKIRTGQITNFRYDPQEARIVPCSD
jgi:hypothetical protein